ncbi:hypothetical protein HDE68_002765 [Pedobacter cryoconitis]|uniref:Uncharacterized protein n=1 Tax=Pedobacter cryoconitis TaxID=188932 RepID=A0A7W8ZMQ4_9SPHI|nr:hypothetical protein [Pedobacter cryoconitis]MBB5636852.1 hypothetical protein [Pedobacter cryoconitis]
MGNIEEPWEPFEIQVLIEGNNERLLVIPDMDEPKYEIFDEHTSIGTVWVENQKQARNWCGEGLVVKELLARIGEQIDDYLNNKPV